MSHRWSGWPGAWCLDCGIEDPNECCLAYHDHDTDPQTCPVNWDEFPKECKEPNSRRCDPYSKDEEDDLQGL